MTSPSNKPKPDQTEADFTKDPVALLVAGAFLGVFAAGLIALVMNAMGVQWTWAYWGASISNSPGSFTKLQVLQGFALLVGGIATFALAAWRTGAASRQAHAANEQVRATFAAQQIDRARQIAELLENDKSEISQISGITAAVELAMSDPERYYLRMASQIALIIRKYANEANYNQAKSDYSAGVGVTILPTVLDTALRELSDLRNHAERAEELERARDWMCDLRRIWLYRTPLLYRNFRRTNFRGVKIDQCIFQDCNFDQSAFQVGASLRNTSFVKCTMRNVQFEIDADLVKADLHDCDLTGASFWQADLEDIRWRGCNLSDVTFKNRIYVKFDLLCGCWCWHDQPPHDGMHAGNFRAAISHYDAGPEGIHRKAYEDAGRLGPPDPEHLLQLAPGLAEPPSPLYP